MTKYWFRICFEKDCENDKEAEKFLDFRLEEIYAERTEILSSEFEKVDEVKE